MKSAYTVLYILIVVTGCNKTDDGSQEQSINGRAAYTSFVTQTKDTLPLNGRHIEIIDSATSAIRDLVTDSAGRFYTPGWSPDNTYDLKVEWEQNDADEYKVTYATHKRVHSAALANVQLTAMPDTTKYQTMLMTVRDVFGGKVPGSRVLLYTTRAIAMLDTTFIGKGALVNLVTNEYGKCMAMRLPTDSLYVKSEYSYNDSTKLWSEILAIKPQQRFIDTSVVVK